MIELTENLLYKLEEKMMLLLTSSEDLRQQIQTLQHENAALKQEKDSNTRKLQDLVSLLDSVNPTEQQQPMMNTAYAAGAGKPSLVQG